jgi:hypothetical protein
MCVWLQAAAAKYMRSALFWIITQSLVVIPYRPLGTTFRSQLQVSKNQEVLTLKNGTDILSRNVSKELRLYAA